MRDADDELVGADAVERRQLGGREHLLLNGQAPARVGEAGHRPLRLGPPENREAPARPVLDAARAGVVLLLKIQQDNVAGVAGREPADLHVVAHQVVGGRKQVVLAFKEGLLEIPVRTPAQHRADLEVLAQDVTHHVLGIHTLGGLLVVGAAGGVDVVVARVPAHLGRIDPAIQAESQLQRIGRHLDLTGPLEVLGPARVLDGVASLRERERLAVGAIDLRVEEEVGGQALGLRRIDAAARVAHYEHPDRGAVVGLQHAQLHRRGRPGREQDVHLVAKAEILAALPHVEQQLALALARIARVKLQDAVFEFQAGEVRAQRLLGEHLDIQEAAPHLALRGVGKLAGVGAAHRQHGRDPGLVVDLDQKRPPALLHQFGRGRTLLPLHAALRVDIHPHQAVAVENLLQLGDGLLGVAGIAGQTAQRGGVGSRERVAQHIERVEHARYIGSEGLVLDRRHQRQLLGPECSRQQQNRDPAHTSPPVQTMLL